MCGDAHKTEYMCRNQTGDISTLEGTPLKLVDKFTYLGSSVESTEKDIETRLTKAWTAINRLLFEIKLFICIKMDLALSNLQRLICHKTETDKQSYFICIINFVKMFLVL